MAESLTLLYTQDLGGDFNQAAQLGRWLREIRASFARGKRVLLLDLGNASAEDSWHHRLTGGRSTLFVLDALGFHAVNACGTVHGVISPALQEGFRMAILGPGGEFCDERGERPIRCVVGPAPTRKAGEALCLSLSPAAETQLSDGVLSLERVPGGCVGRLELWLGDSGAQILESAVHPLPPRLQPEPSITATIELVLAEARQLMNRQQPHPR